ncbi:MAG: metallophosphoesterase [Spirochaetia bacterium]|jgi:Icc-related predicted phosphoesterase
MTLLCLSDIHGEAAGLREILSDASGIDAVVVAGDITHLGGHAEAEAVLAPLAASGIRMLAVAGNMDHEGVRQLLGERGIDIHARGITIGTVGFMGLGGGTPSPFGTPWELSDEEARGYLATGLAAISDAPYKVLVSHAPPRDTKIDRSFAGLHFGSGAVKEFLLSGSIGLCISGHIHEAPGEDKVGSCLCVNLGPFKNGRYALITITDDGPHVTWRKK